jgi:hypothetical protein
MLSPSRTQSVYMDATLVSSQSGKLPGYGRVLELCYNLKIPGTDLDGGGLRLNYLAGPSDTHTLGDLAHLTLTFAEPPPVIEPTGRLHVGHRDKLYCRVYPDRPGYHPVAGATCPYCQLSNTR